MPDREDKVPFRMSRPPDMDGPADPETRVAGPANALMIAALLAVAANCFGGLILNAALSSARATDPAPDTGDKVASYQESGRKAAPFLTACGIGLPTLLIYTLALIGALRMKKLANRGLALTSAVLMMLPCSPVFVVGFPVGLWALAVLKDPEVRAAFRS